MFEALRLAFPLNRVVAFLTPLFAALAGIISAWLADHLPFIAEQVDSGEIEAIFLGGAAAGLAVAYKWLDGWQKHEERQAAELSLLADMDLPTASRAEPPEGLRKP